MSKAKKSYPHTDTVDPVTKAEWDEITDEIDEWKIPKRANAGKLHITACTKLVSGPKEYTEKDVSVFPFGYREICQNCLSGWRRGQMESYDNTTMGAQYQYNDGKFDDKSWLYEQYWGELLSSKEISEKCDGSRNTIRARLDEFGIPKRSVAYKTDSSVPPWEGFYNDDEEIPSYEQEYNIEKSWLYEQYWGELLSKEAIASKTEWGHDYISRAMEKYGIPTRVSNFNNKNTVSPFRGFYTENVDAPNSYHFFDIEKSTLYEQYWGELLSKKEIAKMNDCSKSHITTLMEAYGIPTRVNIYQRNCSMPPYRGFRQ